MPLFFDNLKIVFEFITPSEIVFLDLVIFLIFFPLAIHNPVTKFLDNLLLHVSIKSPNPDNP